MTPADTAELLGAVQAYTGRTVGEVDVAAWHLALGDLQLIDCQAAVVAHYRDSTDWVMPAHIRRAVKAARRDRLAAVPDLPPDADPDDVPGYMRALREGRTRAADGAVPRDMRAIEGTFRSVPRDSA